MTKRERMAWAAGLFDGEGSISYDIASRDLKIRLGMTHEATVRKFARSFRGVRHSFYRRTTSAGRRSIEWQVVRSRDAEKVLGALVPFLVMKRREARIALRWLRARRLHPGVAYSPKEIRAAKRLYLDLRAEKEAVGR